MAGVLLGAVGTAQAEEERTAPNSVMVRGSLGPDEAAAYLVYQRDFVAPLRVTAGFAYLFLGNFQTLEVGVRLLEGTGQPTTEFVPALFVTGGLGRFALTSKQDGHPNNRTTLAATASVLAELRPPQGGGGGAVLSLGLQGLASLAQEYQPGPYGGLEPYDFTVMAVASFGYGF